MIKPGRPESGEYLAYFDTYISLVQETDILAALDDQIPVIQRLVDRIPSSQLDQLHDPYTWTIPQVIGHCIDTERIFGCRICRFAAGDATPLPGFDQDQYVADTDYQSAAFPDLINELIANRQANLLMLRRQDESSWLRAGVADGKNMTVRAAAYVLVGHIRHHLKIIAKRIEIDL